MLEWWSKRPVWQCVTALALGYLFLGGLGPLVMIPVVGMCIFPPVARAVEDWDGFKANAKKTLLKIVESIEKALKGDEHEVECVTPPAPPAPHQHHECGAGEVDYAISGDAVRAPQPRVVTARPTPRAVAAPRAPERTL